MGTQGLRSSGGHSVEYPTILDAARGLLGEAATVLASVDEPYVVIGGWSPVLLSSHRVPHPGTRDVDVLFSRGSTPEALGAIVDRFLDAGYLPSAKHDFQLLRVLRVGMRELVFNVDLLHPDESEPGFHSEMFVKHLDLGVALAEHLPDHAFMRSIVTPHAAFVLDQERFVSVPVDCRLPSGEVGPIDVNIVDELGLVVTKSESVGGVKRQRDAFDIALAISECRDQESLVQDALALRDDEPEVYSVLGKVSAAFHADGIAARLGAYLPPTSRAEAERLVEAVHGFLRAIGVDREGSAESA